MKNASILKGLGNKKKLLPSKFIYISPHPEYQPVVWYIPEQT